MLWMKIEWKEHLHIATMSASMTWVLYVWDNFNTKFQTADKQKNILDRVTKRIDDRKAVSRSFFCTSYSIILLCAFLSWAFDFLSVWNIFCWYCSLCLHPLSIYLSVRQIFAIDWLVRLYVIQIILISQILLHASRLLDLCYIQVHWVQSLAFEGFSI